MSDELSAERRRQDRALNRAVLLSLPRVWPWSREARWRRAMLAIADDPAALERYRRERAKRVEVAELAERLTDRGRGD
ncbi:hypothetical protein [Nocardia iowensis]|uniref:Uncharacterized protein n=1 Tax=Nocardia iowensis TaxID=204891 RepID=A0ABX8S0J4_NOCIO|nr:hypothetical protein [Nocardia iowensis]QXN94722.1 hypothetical protein KV110_17730 [Nocardia iowensis]